MARPPTRAAEDKVRIVLAVLRGEVTIAEAARREAVSQTSIANWRDAFLDGGAQAVAAGGPAKPTSREQQLAVENEQLAAALGEAHMELRLWRKGGALYPGGSSSRPPGSRPA
jgi:transposase